MNDKTLSRLSLAIALIGIIALFAYVQFSQPNHVEISSIDNSMLGQVLEISGKVDSFSLNNGNAFLVIEDGTGQITLFLLHLKKFRPCRQARIFPLLERLILTRRD